MRFCCGNQARKVRLLLAAILAVAMPLLGAPQQRSLNLSFKSLENGSQTDSLAADNVWLYVPADSAPTPFLKPGKFQAAWDGFVTPDEDADCGFRAELNGRLRVALNGNTILDCSTNGPIETASPVHLNKGTNRLKAFFTSPAAGDAFVRLFWIPKPGFTQPIPLDMLSRDDASPGLAESGNLYRGRELFLEFRCAKCHTTSIPDRGVPELAMDAPAFAGIGSRRNHDWIARWVADPKALRPAARMPKILHGPDAARDAEAIADYLSSLQASAPVATTPEADGTQVMFGRSLFDSLHCAACHQNPEEPGNSPEKIPLRYVRQKFPGAALADFLEKPDAFYAWIRMPNFRLCRTEAEQLAAYLVAKADTANKPSDSAPAQASIEQGRKLVQSSGCLNCHVLNIENHFSAPSLDALTADKWNHGCLADAADQSRKAPVFSFTADERAALRAFAATDRGSLARHVPAEFADRQSRILNCRECHGKFDGFPGFDVLGGKLKPEWSKAFIAGEITNKPRPWLAARMPSFGIRAEPMAQGLAMLHGYPPHSPSEPPVDMDKAETGRKLASMGGGFSCVTCHGVGDVRALAFDVAGVNLAQSGARLMKPYAQLWIRNPQLIDPSTKMPVYFDDAGKSPLGDFFGGDGGQQIDALWEYLRLGERMPPPASP